MNFTGGSPDTELLSGNSYVTSGHSGCLGDVMIGANSMTATYITSSSVWCGSDKM